MPDAFDPYHVWLGIPPEEQPANRYRLLGIRVFETNPDVIESAADRQMAHLRTLQSGKNARLSQQLLNELSAARVCLLNPQTKAAYDQQLRAALAAAAAPPHARAGPIVNLPVAQPITATNPQAPPPASDWDQLIGNADSRPRKTSGQSIRSATARRAANNRLIYICIIAALVMVPAAGVVFYVLKANPDAALTFDWPSADRAGARLTIDGQPVTIPANGPWEYRVPPGDHHIVGSRGTYKLETTVTLEAGGEQAISPNWKPAAAVQQAAVPIERDGTLVLDWPVGDRQGAQLTIDGKETPLDDALPLELFLKPGPHELRIVRNGFQTIDQKLAISSQAIEKMKPIWKRQEVIATTGGPPSSVAPPVSDTADSSTVASEADATKKLPVPSDAEQQRIGKQLDETYKVAHSAEKERALAEQFYNLADGAGNSPAERYMLLVRAVGLSAGAGDLNSALHGTDLLDAAYEVDPFEMKQKLVEVSVKSATTAEQVAAVAAAAEQLIDQALADERYDTALAIAEAVSAVAAKPSADPRLRKQIAERRHEILLLQTASAGALEAEMVLEKDADNPDANLTMGRWYCLYKSDWDRGLPLLAKGPDGPFKSLAKQELAVNLELNYQLQLADGWWDQSQKETGLPRDSARVHAAEIYRLMLPNLQPSLKKTTIEKRLAEIDAGNEQRSQQTAIVPGSWDKFDLGRAKLLNGIVRLTPTENEVITKDGYAGPIEVAVVARTERNNIRIYGPRGSSVIFNWERKPGELRINRPDGNDKVESGSLVTAAIPPLVPNKWYSLRWRIADDGIGIWINRKAVFAERRNNNLSAKGRVAVHAVDSNVDVRSFAVTSLKKDSGSKSPLNTSTGSQLQFPRGQWVEVLKLADVTKHTVKGNWSRNGAEISCEPEGEARVEVPVIADGSYDLEVEFTRTDGDADVNTIFTVGDRQCAILLSMDHGAVRGLDRVDGKRPWDDGNPTTVRPGTIVNGHRYRLLVNVRQTQHEHASVDVSLDGIPYLPHWEGNPTSLALDEAWRLPDSRELGLGTWNTRVTFHSMRLKLIAGRAVAKSAVPEIIKTPGVKSGSDSRTHSPVQFSRGQWVDLLRMVDTAKDAINGNWVRSGDEISSEAKRYCRIRLPASIDGSYELEVGFTRTDGSSDVNTIIPVGSQGCMVSLSASDGKVSGIEKIDGHGITDNRNPTGTLPGSLENGHRYKLLIGVRLLKDEMASIEVSLDGKPYLRWQGKLAALSIPERWSLPNPRQLGLGAWKSRVTFHSVRLRMLAGEAVFESPAPQPANLPTIISARWDGGKNWADVTERIQAAVARGDAVQANISFLGADPTPGWKKQLEITFEKSGKPQSAHLNEGQEWSKQDYGE